MDARKIFRLGLYGLFAATLSGCLADPNDLKYARMAGYRGETTKTERVEIEPEDPRELCDYTGNVQGFAVYNFDDLPCPIRVEKTAENDLVCRLRRLQRDMKREFDDTEMADVMNVWSASAHSELEEAIPDGIITHDDLGRPYSEHKQLARAYLQ
jgi:hypothetical protein